MASESQSKFSFVAAFGVRSVFVYRSLGTFFLWIFFCRSSDKHKCIAYNELSIVTQCFIQWTTINGSDWGVFYCLFYCRFGDSGKVQNANALNRQLLFEFEVRVRDKFLAGACDNNDCPRYTTIHCLPTLQDMRYGRKFNSALERVHVRYIDIPFTPCFICYIS